MNEIEKMYENACIEKEYECNAPACCGDLNACALWCKNCKYLISFYPPFTAEKQIELIIWLSKTNHSISINSNGNELSIETFYEYCTEGFRDLSDALASITNILWQTLTSEEKQQIREILE